MNSSQIGNTKSPSRVSAPWASATIIRAKKTRVTCGMNLEPGSLKADASCRCGGRQHHQVDGDGCYADPGQGEHADEGAALRVDRAPGVDRHDDGQGTHVEEHDPDRDGVDGARHVLLWVLGLRSGGAHQLDAAKGEDGDLEPQDEAERAV